MKKMTTILFMIVCCGNLFGMKNNPNQNIQNINIKIIQCNSLLLSKKTGENIQVSQQDLMTLLTKQNELLHKIKRQNRTIIKQNYLNSAHQKLLTERCSSNSNLLRSSYEKSLKQETKLQSKIKETYASARNSDFSWNSSDDDDIFYSK